MRSPARCELGQLRGHRRTIAASERPERGSRVPPLYPLLARARAAPDFSRPTRARRLLADAAVRSRRFRSGGMVLFIPWRVAAECRAGSSPSWRPRRRATYGVDVRNTPIATATDTGAAPGHLFFYAVGIFIFWLGGVWSAALYKMAAHAQAKTITPAQTHARLRNSIGGTTEARPRQPCFSLCLILNAQRARAPSRNCGLPACR